SVDAADERGATALIYAAKGPYYPGSVPIPGNYRVVQLLLSRGADATQRSHGGTALYYAAVRDDKQIVNLLREAGARIELPEAAMIGDTETVRALLDRGEDPNARGPEGDTALGHAAERG